MNYKLNKVLSLLLLGGAIINAGATSAAEPYVSAGNILESWKLNQVPSSARLTNITFRFNIDNETMHARGTYFAQQLFFDIPGSNQGGAYAGLQPRPDRNGQGTLQAIFSSFIKGTTSTDANCRSGADSGPGQSCSVLIPAEYGHSYEITAHKIAPHTWSGEVRDVETGKETHIGSWTLPDAYSDIKPSGTGFVEHYAYYKPGLPSFKVPECSRLARINVLFGPVSTTDYNGAVGNISNAHEYGSNVCKGATSNYSTAVEIVPVTLANGQTLEANGIRIKKGFISDPNS